MIVRKKGKPTTLTIGSIISGTHKIDELLEAYIDTAHNLELTRDERKQVDKIAKSFAKKFYSVDDLDDLTLILESHCPVYTYFGAHEGDGADYGVWVSHDTIEADVRDGFAGKGPDKPNASAAPYNHFIQINDHGNVTVWRKAHTRWVEVWSVV